MCVVKKWLFSRADDDNQFRQCESEVSPAEILALWLERQLNFILRAAPSSFTRSQQLFENVQRQAPRIYAT